MTDFAKRLQEIFDGLDKFEEEAFSELEEFLDDLNKQLITLEDKFLHLFDTAQENSDD